MIDSEFEDVYAGATSFFESIPVLFTSIFESS